MTQEHDMQTLTKPPIPPVDTQGAAVPSVAHSPEKEAIPASETEKTAEKEPEAPKGRGPSWLPQTTRETLGRWSEKWSRTRRSSIEATPTFVVNNASNVLGGAHVLTEMLMFKSGMKGAKLIDDPSNPINWIRQPYQKIKLDILGNSKSRDFSPIDLFRGNPIKNFQHYVMDTHGASERELARQIAANKALGKAVKKFSLGNPWQTRTTGTGLAIWSISTIMPERKESDEEIERMAKKRTLNPLGYMGERLKQAVWVPDWPSHKREMLGLGYLGIGIFSMLGAWRQRRSFSKGMFGKDAELAAKGLQESYTFNGAYFFTGVVSFLAGLPLLFALDERKGYSTYGSLSLLRIPLLPSSLWSKISKGEPGWKSYTIGKLLFQIEDFAFSLIGGAEKRVKPDGSIEIVDHEKLKKEAIKEAKQEKAQRRDEPGARLENHHADAGGDRKDQHDPERSEKPASPGPRIRTVREREHAMPDRIAALEKAQ